MDRLKTIEDSEALIKWAAAVNYLHPHENSNHCKEIFTATPPEIIESLFNTILQKSRQEKILSAINKAMGEGTLLSLMASHANFLAQNRMVKYFDETACLLSEAESKNNVLKKEAEYYKQKYLAEKDFVKKLKGFLDRVRAKGNEIENYQKD